ncbi:hypothetical protein PsorP6_005266 [Peronosclerospora sorghi]|uniref:Uncharacterized protein n=1 Tax=Peronosclerospora sorghi TaxID=230839 RepID=A0ACC0W5A1_9STRA|nr:hypothetical protein PsorP6_005266 [Peronosclerospora sorghi]
MKERLTMGRAKPFSPRVINPCVHCELAIDRFFLYKNDQAAVADVRQGNHAFKIKLVNLDVHLWT